MLKTTDVNLRQPELQSLGILHEHRVDILRLDLIHPEISGNKWYKLKYNIESAQKAGNHSLLTFGGAHSNHIAATAAAAAQYGIKAIAVIRGEEPPELSHTLRIAKALGMQLHFVSRSEYLKKTTRNFINQLVEKFGKFFLVPEGGNNDEGIRGCTEILQGMEAYDYVLCACGTAATFTGLCLAKKKNQVIVGISVLKGENRLPGEVSLRLKQIDSEKEIKVAGNEELKKKYLQNSCILNEYAFSGYAGYNKELVRFKTEIERVYKVPLDHVYTSKLFYALFDLLGKSKFKKDSKILVLHSGGIQGNAAFEERYHLKPIR